MQVPLWSPGEQRKEQALMSRFMAGVGRRLGSSLSYEELYRWSLEESGAFWAELWNFAGVRGDIGSEPYLVDGDRMPGAQFFPNAQLNYAENCLGRGADQDDALVFWGEEKVKRRVTWHELSVAVARAQALFRELGVQPGDRVAAILPNMPESVMAMLAAASLGAVWSSCSPDFGVQGLLDRLGQVAPKVLIISDGYYYNGKTYDLSEKVAAICGKLPTIECIVVVGYLGRDGETVEALNSQFGGIRVWDAGQTSSMRDRKTDRRSCAWPSIILFSSSFPPARPASPSASCTPPEGSS